MNIPNDEYSESSVFTVIRVASAGGSDPAGSKVDTI